MTYDGADYVYKKNLQGDIIGILDSNLNEVVKYTYDSWGKVLSVTDAEGKEVTDEYNIGLVNPFRYKGYYYDYETGYYYLKTRYYNPEWGRFLNADGLFESGHEVLGNNLYTYCSNNPINYCDPDGQLLATLTSVFLTIAGKVAIATGIIVGGTIVTVGVVATVDAIAKATTSNSKRNTTKQDNKTNTKSNKKKSNIPKPPTSKYPTDINTPPAPGFEWKGKGTPGSGKGNYYNPKTGESLRPDLNHPKPIPPHWDYKLTRNGPSYRWFPDGSIEPK